jgi:hypothetical protein
MAKNKGKDTPQTPEEDMAAELLLKDADEALRQEQLKALWDEWGSTIIGVAFMVVFGTMIGVGWQSWRTSVNTAQTNFLLEAERGDAASVEQLYGSHAGLYYLIQSSQVNDPSVIANNLERAGDAGLPREWDILAEWGRLRALADFEANDKNDLADDMMKLAKKRNNPFAPAMMVEASMLKYMAGDPDAAQDILNEAKAYKASANVPTLLQRIASLENLYRNQEGPS